MVARLDFCYFSAGHRDLMKMFLIQIAGVLWGLTSSREALVLQGGFALTTKAFAALLQM